eukprot:gnl/TRDRNA2_/TRDRNA2_129674_c0_seq1.p1 gnl/TRDRNA2_/TRDRNA2_129674_c0~~gnl/TRDRNA2_/TRDRNA2_129674_c0_seq1.p1  ORF type:complete len:117 (+),score=20.92 gnl/TRDRNA2_/TRDRNA2_129674_c0_seq1:46-396(+)
MSSLHEVFVESSAGAILYCLVITIAITVHAAFDQQCVRVAVGRMWNAIGAMSKAVADAEASSSKLAVSEAFEQLWTDMKKQQSFSALTLTTNAMGLGVFSHHCWACFFWMGRLFIS